MPKTIKSQRNILSESEKKQYKINLKRIQNIRKELKLKFPELKWWEIFTEAQARGTCRSKMWSICGVDIVKLEKYIKKHNLDKIHGMKIIEERYGVKSLVIYCYYFD
jgi:hypothetical protein